MPYLKGNNPEAARIHETYQNTNDQQSFLRAARSFLEREKDQRHDYQSSQLTSSPDQADNAIRANTTSAHPHAASVQRNVSSQSFQLGPQDPIAVPPGLPKQTEIGTQPSTVSSPQVPVNLLGQLNANGFRESQPTVQVPQNFQLPLESLSLGPGQVFEQKNRTNPPSLWSSKSSMPPSNLSPDLILASTSQPNEFLVRLRPDPTSQNSPKSSERSITPPKVTPATPSKREAPPPKRLWTQFSEQPGRITVNGISGEDPSRVIPLGPRSELTAQWSIPIAYIKRSRPSATSLDEALEGLTVGLFRRGCTENGSQSSIIAKTVKGDSGHGTRKFQYWKDPASQTICGSVPFYSPRTPGHVLFRLYDDNNPLYTLAISPNLLVQIRENDFEPSIRFLLSNFKGKKSNPTSLSSMWSLAALLETPLQQPNSEPARRVTWGCLQESRKVVEACWNEYTQALGKMDRVEEQVEELKRQLEVEEQSKNKEQEQSTDGVIEEESTIKTELRDKTRILMSGRASCERKWRDSQLAFSSILRAVVSNPSMPALLRRDVIIKMRLEFELWCSLSEEFALPQAISESTDNKQLLWYEPLQKLSATITADEFAQYAQARVKMQLRTLGFEPNTIRLEDVLFPRNRESTNQRTMDGGAVSVFNKLSAAMGKFYQDLYKNEDAVVRLREAIRSRTEQCVTASGAFPPGTKVCIFGSSANGFGSPKSDIDMCLQAPDGQKLTNGDITGAEAMAKLALYFEESGGMSSVDTSRLSARIPIIQYTCPNPLQLVGEGEEQAQIECDLCIHNPLAVLNTAYLRSYAELTPVCRVLASIVKVWAKSRDINNPARHTLSSYGYIIMLLHFLTYHKRDGNGLVSPVAHPEGNPLYRDGRPQGEAPLLPNMHWMDPSWPRSLTQPPPISQPQYQAYREIAVLPRRMIQHPLTEGKTVNTYFYRPSSDMDKAVLQHRFAGTDLSLGILLASFFRYYAFDFDYKRYVVSLHSTPGRGGLVERENKAERDGWRHFSSATLTIEDPFETFYDIAHVLRGGYYHRIRREFAVAYSKIVDSALGRSNTHWDVETAVENLREMSGQDLIDWICEPVATFSSEASSA